MLLLVIAMTMPGAAFAGDSCGAAKNFCSNTRDGIAGLLNDPKCKSNSSCVSCVADNVLGSQISSYCTGLSATDKSQNKQTLAATLYTTTGALCITSCFMKEITYTKAAGEALARVCTGLGLAAAAYDLVSALTSGDYSSAVMGVVGQVATGDVGTKLSLVSKGVAGVAGKAAGASAKEAKKNSCMSGVVLLGTGIAKILSQKSMGSSKSQQCDIVGTFSSSANAAVQTCLGTSAPPVTNTMALTGLFSPTVEAFSGVTTVKDGANALAATASDTALKNAADDIQKQLETAGINFGDVAKKISSGASNADLMSSMGLPSSVTALADDLERRIKAGEKLPGIDMGGGYSGGAGGGLAEQAPSANGDLAFGGPAGATPGEGASESLEIDRKPASAAKVAGLDDGDVFHGAFGGTIFDIVTNRLKAEKSNYAELDPEARMNRLFNGYRDVKSARKPAGAGDHSAK